MKTPFDLLLQGTCIGLLFGFIMGAWIALGARFNPPPSTQPPRYTDGCAGLANSTNRLAYNMTSPATPAR